MVKPKLSSISFEYDGLLVTITAIGQSERADRYLFTEPGTEIDDAAVRLIDQYWPPYKNILAWDSMYFHMGYTLYGVEVQDSPKTKP